MKKAILAGVISASLFGASVSWGESNPDTPSQGSSTGNFDITVDRGTLLRVYGLEDLKVTTAGDNEVITALTPVCVAANVPNYEMALSSGNNNFELELTTGSGAEGIPYTLQLTNSSGLINDAVWGGVGGISSGEYSSASLDRQTNNFDDIDPATCSSPTYNIAVSANTGTVDPGIYVDTVTVVVAPL